MAENPELRVDNTAPGAVLAAARTAQNLSIADVARQLRLSVNQVAALEAGEFERLPAPVFVRGFVRNYARLLKLDPERIVGSIKASVPAQGAHDEVPPSRGIPFPARSGKRWPKFALAALLVVAGLAAYEFYWGEPATVTVTKPVAPPAAPIPAAEQSAQSTAQVPAGPSSARNTAQEAGEPGAQTGRDAPEASPAAPRQSDARSGPAGGELHFTFSRESWVEVRERGGKAILLRLNPGGTERRVSGKPPFKLTIGNAHEVRLTYNDRPVDLERYIVKDDVARFTLE